MDRQSNISSAILIRRFTQSTIYIICFVPTLQAKTLRFDMEVNNEPIHRGLIVYY